MKIEGITPILNVSNLKESFEWFEKLGWKKNWDWGDPPTFGAVLNGKCQIFLCLDCQGAHGTWMSWWVESPAAVDELYRLALSRGVRALAPPEDRPWNVRECHIAHPDGHTFRISSGLGEE